MQVDEEEDVGPDVMFYTDVMLEPMTMMLKVIAAARTDEAGIPHVTFSCPL